MQILLAQANAGNIELPLSYVIVAGGGLTSAIVFIFQKLIASHERRASELLEQIRADRKAADDDRARYLVNLEELVRTVSDERKKAADVMTVTLAQNTEAIRINTSARETANTQVNRMMHEVVGVVILKLMEFGLLPTPKSGAYHVPENQPDPA